MWIPVDQYAPSEKQELLPPAVLTALDEVRTVEPTSLTSGDYEYSILDIHLAGSLSAGLFSADAKGDRVLMTCSSVVFEEVVASNGVRVRKGGAVRLLVGVTRISASFKLSLPAIAAAVEVGLAEAMFRFTWTGLDTEKLAEPLADITATPEPLSLESYKGTLKAMSALQRAILGTKGAVDPRDISAWVDDDLHGDWRNSQAAGRAYGLSAIAQTADLVTALSDIDRGRLSDESSYNQATRAVYREFHVHEGQEPSDAAVSAARKILGRFRVTT